MPILRKLEKEANWQQVVSCDPISLIMVNFLRHYNGYPIDWSALPRFELNPDDKGQVPFDYYLSVYGAKNINKALNRLESDDELELVYPGHYHRLFKRSRSED